MGVGVVGVGVGVVVVVREVLGGRRRREERGKGILKGGIEAGAGTETGTETEAGAGAWV